MKNKILCALFVCACITSVVCGAIVADSVESVPFVPSIIAIVSALYVLIFAMVNCG